MAFVKSYVKKSGRLVAGYSKGGGSLSFLKHSKPRTGASRVATLSRQRDQALARARQAEQLGGYGGTASGKAMHEVYALNKQIAAARRK